MTKGLPFEVDQLAEARSNMKGYRGAWFRCKIKGITGEKLEEMRISVEYYDFPDEAIENIKLCQKAPCAHNKSKKRTQIMVRPCFPPIYYENQLPEISAISELVAVINNGWKVGDLVDWWTDDCWWTGTVTEILEDEKIRIELPPPPLGEGLCYEASSCDLRPALDWSIKNGWTVPRAVKHENSHRCARLITPTNQGATSLAVPVDGELKNANAVNGVSFESNSSFSSLNSAKLSPLHGSDRTLKRPFRTVSSETEKILDLEAVDSENGATNFSETVSGVHAINDSADRTRIDAENDELHIGGSSKKTRGGDIPVNSSAADTLEAAILDLEELVNRVYWLKSIFDFGMPLSRPSWEFLEHCASSEQK